MDEFRSIFDTYIPPRHGRANYPKVGYHHSYCIHTAGQIYNETRNLELINMLEDLKLNLFRKVVAKVKSHEAGHLVEKETYRIR